MSETITADAIREIERLALASLRTQYVRPDGWPLRSLIELSPNGATEVIDIPTQLGTHLETPQAFCAYVAGKSDIHEETIVLYNGSSLKYFADRADPVADHALCQLRPTTEWTWLNSAAGQAMDQAQFVRLMRITLRRCQPEGQLLQILRALKFSAASDAGVELRHGKESMGKSIRTEVLADFAIPEQTTLLVQPWENHPASFPVECAIEVFPAEQRFKLTPFPGDLDRLLDAALRRLAEDFAESIPNVPAYRGSPAPYAVAKGSGSATAD